MGLWLAYKNVNMWSCTAWTYSEIYNGQKPLEPLVDVHCTVCCALRNFFFYLYGKTTVLKIDFLSLVLVLHVVKGEKSIADPTKPD